VACERWQELLVDHANCEKKAASTALSLMFAYADDCDLAAKLSRLAREELRHFEQVQKFMQDSDVPFLRLRHHAMPKVCGAWSGIANQDASWICSCAVR